MRQLRIGTAFGFAALLAAQATFAAITKVTLVVNYGEGAILHSEAIAPFKSMMNALKAEKGFELTITEQTHTAAQKSAALNELKNMDVVLFANIGNNAFRNAADQLIIQNFFTSGGKAIGYHASIDHHTYWPWWATLHNGSGFQGHGNGAFVLNESPEMAAIPALKKMWDENALGNASISSTEIYTLNVYPRGKEGVTIMQSVAPPKNAVANHDFTWHKKIGTGGEYIFTCLGHASADFNGGWLQKATWAWMEYLDGKYNSTSLVADGSKLGSNSVRFAGNRLEIRYANAHSLTMLNVKGEAVLAESARGFRDYDLARFQPGYYFVRIKGAEGTHNMKVLIK